MAGPLRAPLSKASANYIIQEIAPDLGDAPLFGHCKCRPVLEPGHCNVQCRRLDSGSFLYQFLFLVDRYKKRAESVTHSRTTQFL